MSLTVLAAAVIVQHVVACVSLVCSREKFGLHTSIGKVAASAIVPARAGWSGGGLVFLREVIPYRYGTDKTPFWGLLHSC